MKTALLKKALEYKGLIDTLLGGGFGDIVLYGGNIVNVITGEIYQADIAIKGRYILMVGDCSSLIGEDTQVIDVRGKYICPGFIDSHMHFESSMLTIGEFCRLSIPTGTTTIIADPHEIANAAGIEGIRAMAEEAALMPSHVYLAVPALTPDCPELETPGFDIGSEDMEELLSLKGIAGIGELQGVSSAQNVYDHTPHIIDDLLASTLYGASIGKTVDGNAPALFEKELAAHIICTGGKCSCHETTTKEECIEKLRYGVHVFMREGSTQKNMAECIKAVTEEGMDSRRLILATDDMLADDLMKHGHMNEIIRRTIAQGVSPVQAIQLATINPAAYFGLRDTGVLSPGKLADIAVINSLEKMDIAAVFLEGKPAAVEGELILYIPSYKYPQNVRNSIHCKSIKPEELEIYSDRSSVTARCIVLIPDQNLTEASEEKLKTRNGVVECNGNNDILYISCVHRYGRNHNIGRAFVKGFGLKEGAFAESVSHDSHNIIAVGTNTADMAAAINRVIELQGGITIVKNGKILDELSLPVGGLMTDELNGKELGEKLESLHSTMKMQLGCRVHAPFMHLSFLSLSTSPSWKITDKGLVDVNSYRILEPIIV